MFVSRSSDLLFAHNFSCGGRMPFPYEMLPGGETRDKLRISPPAAGPTDFWRVEEDRAEALGNTLSVYACASAGVEKSMLGRRFCGINFEFRSVHPATVFQDYPSVKNQPNSAAAEQDRLASLGKIHWYAKDCAPPDLRVCPSHLIAKGEEVRVVRDRSNRKYGLNGALINPPAKYGEMGEFSRLLSPGSFMCDVDSQGLCLLRVGVSWGFGVRFPGDSVYICSFHLVWGPLQVGMTVASKKCYGWHSGSSPPRKSLISCMIRDRWTSGEPMMSSRSTWLLPTTCRIGWASVSTRGRASMGGPRRPFRVWDFWRIPMSARYALKTKR